MKTRTEYWDGLSKTRKGLLVVGMVVGLPVVLGLILIVGFREAYLFLTETT